MTKSETTNDEENQLLRDALMPLALVAKAIDGDKINFSMSDTTGIWSESSNFKENVRLTVGDARNARRLLNV